MCELIKVEEFNEIVGIEEKLVMNEFLEEIVFVGNVVRFD